VRVKTGPLRGLEGILVRQKNWCKLLLSVEMLQRSVAVEVDLAIVERVGWRSPAESSLRTARLAMPGLQLPVESL
jgi:hypothetical protein